MASICGEDNALSWPADILAQYDHAPTPAVSCYDNYLTRVYTSGEGVGARTSEEWLNEKDAVYKGFNIKFEYEFASGEKTHACQEDTSDWEFYEFDWFPRKIRAQVSEDLIVQQMFLNKKYNDADQDAQEYRSSVDFKTKNKDHPMGKENRNAGNLKEDERLVGVIGVHEPFPEGKPWPTRPEPIG